jgi:hypothetical protein
LRGIRDRDVQILAAHSRTLESDYASEEDEWDGSPFAWIKKRPSRQVGKIGESLVAGWLATKGLDVARAKGSEADLIITARKIRVEVKFSTLWKTGCYKFQQLRDQDYRFAICLGISPFDAHCWAIPKTVILDRWRKGDGISSQHRGKAGSDTAWLSVSPGEEPTWLREHGGSCSAGFQAITKLTRAKAGA